MIPSPAAIGQVECEGTKNPVDAHEPLHRLFAQVIESWI